MSSAYKYRATYLNKDPGVWLFVVNGHEVEHPVESCNGYGVIKYNEGSVYSGDVFFDGLKYNKIGNGRQDFSESILGAIDVNINEKPYLFVGQFNYKQTDWIYGNGVLYYKYADGKPSHFIKAFFSGLNVFKPYEGTFDYSNLEPGYTKEMEFDYSPRDGLFNKQLNIVNSIKNLKFLFLGDSFIEFWQYESFTTLTFYKIMKNGGAIGLGGATYDEFLPFIKKIKIDANLKYIVVNFGFNDLHSMKDCQEVLKAFILFNKELKKYFKKQIILYTLPIHSPLFLAQYFEKEEGFAEIFKNYAMKNGIRYIETDVLFENIRKNCTPNQYKTLFNEDLIHLSANGYKYFERYISNFLI